MAFPEIGKDRTFRPGVTLMRQPGRDPHIDTRSIIVLKGAAVFAIIALVLAVLGFAGLAGFAWGLAKILFWFAVAIAVVLAALGFTIYKKVT